MAIERIGIGPRMGAVAVAGNLIFTSGQVLACCLPVHAQAPSDLAS